MSVRVEGVSRTIKRLKKLGEAAHRRASTEVVKSALKIQADAKNETPVDTGRLRNSITVADTEADVPNEGPGRLSAGTLTAAIGTKVEYAVYVHFGARGRNPRPFLFHPFEAERPQLLQRLRAALKEEARGV